MQIKKIKYLKHRLKWEVGTLKKPKWKRKVKAKLKINLLKRNQRKRELHIKNLLQVKMAHSKKNKPNGNHYQKKTKKSIKKWQTELTTVNLQKLNNNNLSQNHNLFKKQRNQKSQLLMTHHQLIIPKQWKQLKKSQKENMYR